VEMLSLAAGVLFKLAGVPLYFAGVGLGLYFVEMLSLAAGVG